VILQSRLHELRHWALREGGGCWDYRHTFIRRSLNVGQLLTRKREGQRVKHPNKKCFTGQIVSSRWGGDITLSWARGRIEYVAVFPEATVMLYVSRVVFMAEKRRESAHWHSCSKLLYESERKPTRTSLLIMAWSRTRPSCPTNPHQSGVAYNILVTSTDDVF